MTQSELANLIEVLGVSQDSAQAVYESLGKEITSVTMIRDVLRIHFADDKVLALWDDGQSCCESRYMTTDDKLEDFIGATLTKIEVNDGPELSDQYGEPHEQQFVIVTTSIGRFTLVTHNEHNGYYGGFALIARLD